MRLAAPLALILALLFGVPGPSQAEEVRTSFNVRLLGLPVGKIRFAAREEAGAYAVTGVFDTSGIGRIVEAGFRLSAQGRDKQGRLSPQAYDERINTGSRRSTASLRYKGGVPRITGGSVAAEVAQDPDALNPATQGGTVDPMTALWGVLRDQPLPGLCNYDVTIFDGQRRARLAMTERRDGAGQITCAGAYTRLAGFSASEMKRQSVYPFAVTYTPAGTVMRAKALTVKSAYGTAEMTRD
ncbi:DUF3108 domain-containing protein [Roseovarius sp. S4756]|uniref:DUF3108 domain-containing protein n=1 Tax=Roseovarius maritimus TaxID=3342637 RepID=UPI003729AA28